MTNPVPIADPTVPVVEIHLDKVRHLVYDFAALAAIEENYKGESVFRSGVKTDAAGNPVLDTNPKSSGFGQPIAESLFWKDISASKLIVVLWAGLLDEDPEIKLEDVKKLLRRRDPAPIIQKIMQAWGLAAPEAKPNADPTPPATETPRPVN